MTQADLQLPQTQKFGQTSRTDRWWLQPLLVFCGLSAFIVYSTWAALQGVNYFFDVGGAHYLSPMYSPVLFDAPGVSSGHSLFGDWPTWWPAWLPATPALLILWAPGGFRFTCYYYRGAYYKAFWADPSTCAVGEPRKTYLGENSFPLIFQNIHRYFMYIALMFIVVLAWDAIKGFTFKVPDGNGGESLVFGVGVGSLVMTLNVILLGGYTLGCHSLRHIIGGKHNCLSGKPLKSACYGCVSGLNSKHMLWAWMSLFWVGFTDAYVRLCAAGIWTDFHWTMGG